MQIRIIKNADKTDKRALNKKTLYFLNLIICTSTIFTSDILYIYFCLFILLINARISAVQS